VAGIERKQEAPRVQQGPHWWKVGAIEGEGGGNTRRRQELEVGPWKGGGWR
jgi:hypothetical protein